MSGLTKGADVFLPSGIIEVHTEQPRRVVREQGVDSGDIPAVPIPSDQMGSNGFGRQWYKFPIWAIRTAKLLFVADTRCPLISAGGSITGFLRFAVIPAPCVYVVTAVKELHEQLDFFFCRAFCMNARQRRRCGSFPLLSLAYKTLPCGVLTKNIVQ